MQEERRPNVILIVADDHGYADFSRLGIHDYIQTPCLDRFAAEGVTFSDAYATSPVCNPSRCGLLTGRYQQRWGTYWFLGREIPGDVSTVADKFKSLGYSTGYLGKLHYGHSEAPDTHGYPTNHGFDECLCAPPGGRVHYLHHTDAAVERYGEAARQMCVFPMTRNGEKQEYEGFMTELLGEEARGFVSRHQAEPFFLQVAFNAVHNFNFQLPEAYLEKWDLPPYPDWDATKIDYREWYNEAIAPNLPRGRLYYAAQLYYLDREIGRLVEHLKGLGLDDNTVILYVSDNGGSNCNCGDNTPLRGTKYTLFEGGIRVPMLMRWPRRLTAGATCDVPTSGIDVCATLLDAAGAGPELCADTDGLSVWPALAGGEPPARDVLHWDCDFQWAVRKGKWKLKVIVDQKRADETAAYEHTSAGRGTELYDLSQDLAEQRDLAAQHPEVVEELTELHRAWREEITRGHLRTCRYRPLPRVDAQVWQEVLRGKLHQLLKTEDQATGGELPFHAAEISSEAKPGYVMREIEIDSTPWRRIRAAVTLPDDARPACPAVVCIHGHSGTRHSVHDPDDIYKGFAAKLAASGYVTIATDVGQHEVCEEGRTLMGERLWDLMRCVDYLRSLDRVDSARIGCAGLSLGGEMAMWLGAMDERVAAVASSGFLTKMDQMEQDHCMCWKLPGLRELVDFADIYALIAPRPLLCQNGLQESAAMFYVPIARAVMEEVQLAYSDFGCAERAILQVHDGGHVIELTGLVRFLRDAIGP